MYRLGGGFRFGVGRGRGVEPLAGGLLEDAAEGVGGFGEALLDFEGVEAGESGGEFGFEFLLEGGVLVGGEVAEVGAGWDGWGGSGFRISTEVEK